jgi:hypothetical protein
MSIWDLVDLGLEPDQVKKKLEKKMTDLGDLMG